MINTKMKFLDQWKPSMAVFMESDFWPNLIYLTANSNIPTILASSQMSDKSARFWTGLGYFLAKKIFSKVDHVLAVDPKQEALFKKLGAKNVKSLTSLKSIAIFHPAFLLRQPSRKREAWEDLKKIKIEIDTYT